MPKVGSKHFSYDAEGLAKAQAEAARTGTPVEHSQRYHVGGLLKLSSKKNRDKTRGVGKAKRGLTHVKV